MGITRPALLQQLLNEITAEEWEELIHNRGFPINDFNRGVLLEMRTADVDCGADDIREEDVTALRGVLEDFLGRYLSDGPDAWKWIIISCTYLTYIAERPMHPIDVVGIQEVTVDGKRIYECPSKSDEEHTACHFCVCRRMPDRDRAQGEDASGAVGCGA